MLPNSIPEQTSLVSKINSGRDREDARLQENLRHPRAPRLRRIGNNPPRDDGRPGGVDNYEYDYGTAIVREQATEIRLPGYSPLSSKEASDLFWPSRQQADYTSLSASLLGVQANFLMELQLANVHPSQSSQPGALQQLWRLLHAQIFLRAARW